MTLDNITIRPLQSKDNKALAHIIRTSLEEYGANKPGTVYFDPTTDDLYQLFQTPKSAYYVAESGMQLLGGGGIYPTQGLPPNTCELVKMYLIREARGKGMGKLIIEKSLNFAKEQGFKYVYLETMPELRNALKVYEVMGFEYLQQSMGDLGHFGCDLWMLKKL